MIETEHLLLRKASFADCDKFAEWESRKNVIQHFCIDGVRDLDRITDEFHSLTHDDTRQWLTILFKETKQPIGRVGITGINEINDWMDLTIIYIADEEMRGHGYGAEAIEGVLEYAFTTLDMHRVSLYHFLDDEVGAHLYEKLGFRREGIMKNAGKKNTEYFDLQLRAILKEEWEEQREIRALEAEEAKEAEEAAEKK
jgi:ribosomal-protein-alanine N-acetyltransferase